MSSESGTKRSRGPHPRDKDEFSEKSLSPLRQAASDFSLLLTMDYPETASLKLVGDRFRLSARQRLAVRRSSCSESQFEGRLRKCASGQTLAGERVLLDGFNIIVTLESALSGAVLLRGRDTVIRDIGSVHGTYRQVHQTEKALQMIGRWYHENQLGSLSILLDQPISNSGRLAERIRKFAVKNQYCWEVETVASPDRVLAESTEVVATADSWILDECQSWTNLTSEILSTQTGLWMMDLSRESEQSTP